MIPFLSVFVVAGIKILEIYIRMTTESYADGYICPKNVKLNLYSFFQKIGIFSLRGSYHLNELNYLWVIHKNTNLIFRFKIQLRKKIVIFQ